MTFEDDEVTRAETPTARMRRELGEQKGPASMSDDGRAKQAIQQAIEASRTPEMNQRAADDLRAALVSQEAAFERRSTRMKVALIHGICGAAFLVALVLRFTVLKPWQDLGETLCGAVLFLWAKTGFRPSDAVLAQTIVKLAPQRLEKMLSLRPSGSGTSLYPPPPPSAASTQAKGPQP